MLCDDLEEWDEVGGRRDEAWSGWEQGPRGRGYMYTYTCFTSLYRKNQHNIVKLLCSNMKKFLLLQKRQCQRMF